MRYERLKRISQQTRTDYQTLEHQFQTYKADFGLTDEQALRAVEDLANCSIGIQPQGKA